MIDQLASGSAPKVVGQEVKGLRSLGHDVEAIVIKKGYSHKYDFHLSNVPIKCLLDHMPLANFFDFRFPGFSFFSLHHLTTPLFSPFFIKKSQWDVLVILSSYTCITGRALKKLHGIPYFAFIGTEPSTYILHKIYSKTSLKYFVPFLQPFASFLDRFVVEDCLAIITFSKLYHPLLQQYTSKPLEVLYPGCFPVDKPKENREDFILTFDRWDIGNTPQAFLDILPRLSRDVNLIVAGYWYPESIKSTFEKEVAKRKLTRRVKIIGPLDEKAIIDFCSRALVLVHLNKEAFGMQALEAAACGCPIIIPEGSGVTELFTNGVHGFFPKEGDINGYVECLEQIIADPKKARKMGYEAWKAAKKYTWNEHAIRLDEIIRKYL